MTNLSRVEPPRTSCGRADASHPRPPSTSQRHPRPPPLTVHMPVLEVVVPDCTHPGDVFSVETCDGHLLSVALPPGYYAGDMLPIEAPSAPASPQPASPSLSARKPSSDSVMCDFDIVVPAGIYAGETFSVETDWGETFDIQCPAGCSAGTSITCSLPAAPAPTTGRPYYTDQCHHRYAEGQRVQVRRSDGSYSLATVEDSFEGVFDVLYSVRIVHSGLCKPAVPEDEMYSAEDADDPAFGAHLEAAMAAMLEAAMLDESLDDYRACPFDESCCQD